MRRRGWTSRWPRRLPRAAEEDPQAPHPAPARRADGLPFRRLGGGLDDRAPDRQVRPGPAPPARGPRPRAGAAPRPSDRVVLRALQPAPTTGQRQPGVPGRPRGPEPPWWHRYSSDKVAYWGRARTPPTPPGRGSSCRPARTGALRPPGRTCAAGTDRGMCRSASPSTTGPSALGPGRPSPCHRRRRAGSSDRSAGSASTSSPWTSTPPPRHRSGSGWRPH